MERLDPDACYRAIRSRDVRFDGKLFIGVKTTGVYCRPICPARTPKRENIEFHFSAASAHEAGFRPCLRCRPEVSPQLAAWRGTSNTVSRALSLIEMGALDDADIAALCERLGVGERQLRRLFRQHIGAAPIAVAQTRRILLAKQLIHETQMPMAEVALASGFGSVRRFNETFQQLYGRPPSAIRRGSTSDASSASNGELSILLRYRPPYDWTSMLAFLAKRALPGVEVVEPDQYARTIEIGTARGCIWVRPGDGDALQVTVRFPQVSALPAIIARLRRVFDLSADPEQIAAWLSEDATLAPLVAARPGLRVPGAWDGFELAVRAMLGQQITVRAAVGLGRKLVCAYGQRIADEGSSRQGLMYLFPRPERLADADLTTLGMPQSRARALSALARAAVADPQLFDPQSTLQETIVRLRALPGVGEWTAQYIAMRALREPDAFPASDIGLLRALADADGRRPSPRDLLARAESWRPWRAYAAQQLWDAHASVRG